MAKQSSLSNRKRALVRKAVAKAARAKPAAAGRPAAEPVRAGAAAQAALVGDITAVEGAKAEAALVADAVGERGPVDPRKAVAAEFDVAVHDGRIQVASRDGLASLYRSQAITQAQAQAGMAYRLCYEAAAAGLKSGLGNAGEGGGGTKVQSLTRSAAALHRSYIMARLNQMERAVNAVMTDGRELHALRMIAGEGQTARSVAGSGGWAATQYRDALVRGLDAIARLLRITER